MLKDISKLYFEGVSGILPRRYGLKSGKHFLYGAPACGKTSLALIFGAKYKKALYIDCADSRFCLESAQAQILKSYLERDLELLIIDNFTNDLSLPNIANVICISSSQNHCPQGFSPKHIRALSFEEYISFDSKNMSINHLFNRFLKEGNLPEVLHLAPHFIIKYKQNILKLALWQDYELFCSMLKMQGASLSPHHIFTLLKKSHKLSKDRIYRLLHSLQSRGIIYFVPYIGEKPIPSKKLYFYDFTLPMCVLSQMNLQSSLENMLLLELINICERMRIDEVIYYGDFGEFVSAFGVFLFMPFANKEQLIKRRAQMQKHAFVYFITFEYECKESTWEALSFANFALEFMPHF